LRESETRAAVAKLGMDPQKELRFLSLPDRSVPGNTEAAGFHSAVQNVAELLVERAPDTVVAPLRIDAHADHRATFRIVEAALDRLQHRPRLLEYGIWAGGGEVGAGPEAQQGPYRRYGLDVSAVLRRKRSAVRCHRSQTTNLIDDDPSGFRLGARAIAGLTGRWEVFFEMPTDRHADAAAPEARVVSEGSR
jgi:LmbE family N-acetylglucosaminyl deacetylase